MLQCENGEWLSDYKRMSDCGNVEGGFHEAGGHPDYAPYFAPYFVLYVLFSAMLHWVLVLKIRTLLPL